MSYLSICQSRLPFAFSQVQGKAENAVQRGGKWEGQSIAFETERRLLLRTSSSAVESFENGSPNAVEHFCSFYYHRQEYSFVHLSKMILFEENERFFRVLAHQRATYPSFDCSSLLHSWGVNSIKLNR